MSWQEEVDKIVVETSDSWMSRVFDVGEHPENVMGILIFFLVVAVITLYWAGVKKDEKYEAMMKDAITKMTEVNKHLDDNTIEKKIDDISHQVNNISMKLEILNEKLKS